MHHAAAAFLNPTFCMGADAVCRMELHDVLLLIYYCQVMSLLPAVTVCTDERLLLLKVARTRSC